MGENYILPGPRPGTVRVAAGDERWWVGAGWVGDAPGTVAAPSVRVAEERGGVYENKVHCTLEILASTGRKFHAAGEVCITWPNLSESSKEWVRWFA